MGKEESALVEWLNYRIHLSSEKTGQLYARNNRSEILKTIFTAHQVWEYREQTIQYDYERTVKENFIIGHITYKKERTLNNKDFTKRDELDWVKVWCVINIDPNYQTISVLRNSGFGEIIPKLSSFSRMISNTENLKNQYYEMQIFPILHGTNVFWNAIKGAQIFEFAIEAAPPNFFDDEIHEQARKDKEDFGSSLTRHTILASEEPLRINEANPHAVKAVHLAENGSCRIFAKGRKEKKSKIKVLFDSKEDNEKNTLRIKIQDITMELIASKEDIRKIIMDIIEKNTDGFEQLPNKSGGEPDQTDD